MALLLTEPIKTVNGLLTKALAAEAQLLYQFQRQDLIIEFVTSSTQNPGALRLFISKAAYPAEPLTQGATIYIGGGDYTGYNGLYVVGAQLGDSESWKYEIGGTYINPNVQTGGFANDLTTRPAYRVSIRLFTDAGVEMYNRPFLYVPPQSGTMNVNLALLVSYFMQSPFTFSQEFYIEYDEEWTGKEVIVTQTWDSSFAGSPDGMVCQNLADSSVFSVGEFYYFTFASTYTDGLYSIASIPNATSIRINIGYIGSTSGTIGTQPPVQSTTLQAVQAFKQILKVGGANMWENLLREQTGFFTPALADWYSQSCQANDKVWVWQGSYWRAEGMTSPIAEWSQGLRTNDISIEENAIFQVRVKYAATTADAQPVILQILNACLNQSSQSLTTVNGTIAEQTFDFSPHFNEFTSLALRIAPSANNGTVNVDIYEIEVLPTQSESAKFLTRFTNPVMWRGWNRTAAALVDSECATRTGFNNWRMYSNEADINKNVFGSTLNNGDSFFSFNPDVYVRAVNNPSEQAAYQRIAVREASPSIVATEYLFYEVRNECPNAIMLDWLNTAGGVDQWLFSVNQRVQYQVGEGVLAEAPINEDIEFITRTKQRFPGARRQQITCTAEQLTGDQLIALAELKQTESLRVYLTKDGTEFVDAVVVNDFATEFRTENVLHTYSVTIEFPDDFDFFSAKKY